MALRGPTGPRFAHSPHLVALVAETERLVDAVAAAPQARQQSANAHRVAAILASLRLDGSPLTRAPGPPADAEATVVRPDRTQGERPGTWLDALGTLEDPPDGEIQALEYAGVAAGLASEDLVATILTEPVATIRHLHRRVTRGLVAPDRAGAPRTGHRAVEDRSVGRVLFFPPGPAVIPAELETLGAWVESAATREHGLIVSGVVHAELLRIQPFDAANGRVARAAARLALRARGLDPGRLAAPETALAADPLGYHEEIAGSLRRRDLSISLERWGDAVTAGLRDAARALGQRLPEPPTRARAFVTGLTTDAFTVADYRSGAEVDPETARTDLEALLDAGQVTRVAGSRGLRYLVTADPATTDRTT